MTMQLFLIISNLKRRDSSRKSEKLSRLALHLVLLSQGVPFIHAGQEFYRTKGLEDNTYNLPDSLNQLDWTSLPKCQEEIAFLEELIAYRKSQPLLRLKKGKRFATTVMSNGCLIII